MEKKHLIVIGGPTASGKSAVAVQLCQMLGGEVVSADSMQIYQGMAIGTAQPTLSERCGIAHHLIGFLPPEQTFTAAMYREAADPLLAELWSRSVQPIVCGGTGLYIDALTRPMSMSAPSDDALRARLNEIASKDGGRQTLYERLMQADPASAARLHPNDLRRVIRALEIYELTGHTMTEQNELDRQREDRYDVSLYALSWPREQLYERINRRVDQMMADGLVDEVKALLLRSLPRDATALQALGCKEIACALDGKCTMEEAVEQIKLGSRRYAKRQETWFHRDQRCVWLAAEGQTAAQLAQKILEIEESRRTYGE